MKTCSQIRECFSEFIDRRLDFVSRKDVEEHLLICGECRAEFHSMKKANDLLDVLDNSTMSHKTKDAIIAKSAITVRKSSVIKIMFTVTAVAALILAVLLPFRRTSEHTNVIGRHEYEDKLAQHVHAVKVLTRQVELSGKKSIPVLEKEVKTIGLDKLTSELMNVSVEGTQPQTVTLYLTISSNVTSSISDGTFSTWINNNGMSDIVTLRNLADTISVSIKPKPLETVNFPASVTNQDPFISGRLYVYCGNYDKAVQCFDDAASVTNLTMSAATVSDAIYWKAEALAMQGKVKDAVFNYVSIPNKKYLDTYVARTVSSLAKGVKFDIVLKEQPISSLATGELEMNLKDVNTVIYHRNGQILAKADEKKLLAISLLGLESNSIKVQKGSVYTIQTEDEAGWESIEKIFNQK